jgi:hypothetical protein
VGGGGVCQLRPQSPTLSSPSGRPTLARPSRHALHAAHAQHAQHANSLSDSCHTSVHKCIQKAAAGVPPSCLLQRLAAYFRGENADGARIELTVPLLVSHIPLPHPWELRPYKVALYLPHKFQASAVQRFTCNAAVHNFQTERVCDTLEWRLRRPGVGQPAASASHAHFLAITTLNLRSRCSFPPGLPVGLLAGQALPWGQRCFEAVSCGSTMAGSWL